ncbi:MAG: hypothetical protein AAGI63_14815 [Planctomycetota bacterium]
MFALRLRWTPVLLLAVTSIIQVAVWNPPPDIRWSGSLSEWPVPWMICCRTSPRFTAVLVSYLLACLSCLAIALTKPRLSLIGDATMIGAFPMSVYIYMYWHYFGFPGR